MDQACHPLAMSIRVSFEWFLRRKMTDSAAYLGERKEGAHLGKTLLRTLGLEVSGAGAPRWKKKEESAASGN